MTDVVAVLGMHRSGTSATAGVLTKLGGGAPKNLMPANSGNLRGYFESVSLMHFHDELLASAGCHWDDWRKFNPSWYRSAVVETFKERAKKLFRDEFAHVRLAVLKDPRICRFAPFWIDVFEDMGMMPRIVMPIRSPLEVAQSLKTRDMMSTTKALLLWLRHVLDAEAETRNLARSIFTWEQFLSDWRGVADKISLETGLAWSRLSDRTGYEIDKFLGAELVHHRIAHADLAVHSDVHEWTLEAYDALLELARNPFSNSATERLDRIRALFDQSSAMFGRVLVDYEINLEDFQTQATAFRNELDILRNQQGDDKTQLSALAEERDRLAVELHANRQQLTNTAALLNDRTQSLGAIEAQLLAAHQEKEQLLAALARREADLAAAADDKQRMSTELQARVQEIAELNAAVAGHAEHAAQVEGELAVTHQQLKEARQENMLFLNVLETREKELGLALEERQSLVVTLQAREASLLEAMEDRRNLATRAERAEAELTALAYEKDRFSQDLAAQAAMLAESIEEHARLASELEAREQALVEVRVRETDLAHRAQQAEAEMTLVAQERERLSSELAAYEANLAVSVEECGRLASELECREEALATATTIQADLIQRLEQGEAAREQLISERDELSTGMVTRTMQLRAILDEREQLLTELRTRQSEIDNTMTLLSERSTYLEQMDADLATARFERERALREHDEIATLLEATLAEKESMARAKEDKAAAVEELVTRCGELDARLDLTNREKDRLTADLDRMTLDLRHMEITADRAAARAAAMVETEDKLEAQIRALRSQIIDSEAALARSNVARESLAIIGMRPLANHRLRQWGRKLARSGLFDADWYKETYSDVGTDRRSPVRHYLEDGYLRGYRPNPLFDTRWYLERYDDVRRSGVNPLIHYMLHGWQEGRDPGPDFQTNFYLLTYPDVRASGMSPLGHYLLHGRGEGRRAVRPQGLT